MSVYSVTLNATGATKIASANQNVGTGGWYLVVTANTNSNGTAWNGSLVLARDLNAPGTVPSPCPAVNLTNVAYYNPSTGAAIAAGTAITGTGNWQVGLESTAYDLYLNHTLTTAATTVTVTAMPGAALSTDPSGGPVTAAANIERGTFGANIPDTGAYAFPAALSVGGQISMTAGSGGPNGNLNTLGNDIMIGRGIPSF